MILISFTHLAKCVCVCGVCAHARVCVPLTVCLSANFLSIRDALTYARSYLHVPFCGVGPASLTYSRSHSPLSPQWLGNPLCPSRLSSDTLASSQKLPHNHHPPSSFQVTPLSPRLIMMNTSAEFPRSPSTLPSLRTPLHPSTCHTGC